MVDFAGWEMPLHYGSILDEHHQVRNGGGFFDVSHMGRVRFTGRDARKFLDVGERKGDPGLPPAEFAALTMLANQMFNLDEALNQ